VSFNTISVQSKTLATLERKTGEQTASWLHRTMMLSFFCIRQRAVWSFFSLRATSCEAPVLRGATPEALILSAAAPASSSWLGEGALMTGEH